MTDLKNNKIIKIAVPLLLVLVVAGIWFAKNSENQDDLTIPTVEGEENEDFSFESKEPFDVEHLKSYGLPIILDFGAETCPPCKVMKPDLIALNAELRNKAIIRYADVWADSSLADGYPVSSIPTQFFFDKDGNPFNPEDPEKYNMTLYTLKDSDEHVLTAHVGILTKAQMLEILYEMGMEDAGTN